MAVFKGRGVILRERDMGESDKLLTLLLKDKGRLTISARGARKPKSKFMAAAQLFTYADFVIYQGSGFYALAQIDIIESFYPLRTSLETLCYAQLFAELCEKTIMENMPSDDILLLLLKAFQKLSEHDRPPVCLKMICGAFLFKYLQLSGYEPEPGMVKASNPTEDAISYILNAEIKDTFRFRLDEKYAKELNRAGLALLEANVDVTLKTLEMLN